MLARSNMILITRHTILSIRCAMKALGADTIAGVKLLLICKGERLVRVKSAPSVDLTASWVEVDQSRGSCMNPLKKLGKDHEPPSISNF